MQNKIKLFLIALGAISLFTTTSFAEDVDFDDTEIVEESLDEVDDYEDDDVAEVEEKQDEEDVEALSAQSIADYEVNGSLFQQITDLEQEKILIQLEKERAQLNLDLDRLAAEKIKLNMEMENLSGRAEQQQQELITERARLEAEAQKLEAQKQALEKADEGEEEVVKEKVAETPRAKETEFGKRYKLVNVIGVGTQLQATIQDVVSGQNKKMSVGKILDGYTVKSISLDEGVVFEKGSEMQSLNIENKK